MDEQRYILLLNHCLKKHMVGMNRKEKERLREKFEFLETGIWDSGVRVKKLKGVWGKVIFEARLSRGERIIFTLGKHGSKTIIYIWGLVKHDDITKTAKNIFPENAPFLNFKPEISEDHPEILMEELSEEYYSQEVIEERSPEDYGPQKWLVLDDEEWKRMLLAADPDNFEIFLFLTSEQYKILETEPPILISGTAGSGKTTLSVYYLLNRNFLNKKRLFLTYNRYLNDFSQKIYSGLVSGSDLDNSNKNPDFYVFRDLLHELTKGSEIKFDKNKEVGLREFEHIFRKHRFYQKYDAELVWEEIRSIVKGAKPPVQVERFKKLSQTYIRGDISLNDFKVLKEHLLGFKSFEFMDKIERTVYRKTSYAQFDDFVKSMAHGDGPAKDEQKFILGEIRRFIGKKANSLSTPLLTYKEYLNLGKKRAPNFLYERKDIYDIAEFYQGKLDERGQWDEIDLCRQAIRQIEKKQGTRFSYDLVVCDEVQDFSDIQLSLIFNLAKSHRGIVLTGDPKQIINPSGFRWEEVKNKYYERGIDIPDVYHLNLNFRCVGNIVKLSNALLDLKQELVGLSGSEMREEWKFNGRPPFLLTGMGEKEVLGKLHLKGTGKIILVRNVYEQKKLKQILGTELIFTISEAKGLEFDTVFLWKFSSDKKSSDIWRRVKNGSYLDRSHYPHLKHEINLLYVAITRARNTLIIFDSSSYIWDLPLLQNLLYKTEEKEVLSEIWQSVSTPEEWEKQGDYFYEREYYPAAAECYKNAGNIQRSEIATAFDLERRSHFKAAAQLFEKYSHDRKAAECYENAKVFEKALLLWEELKDHDHIVNCRINLYEQNGEYNKAADAWSKQENYSRALENWIKANNHRKIAEYYLFIKKYGKAAEAFERARAYEEAASCHRKAKQHDRAADLFYRAGAFEKAIPLYKKLKNRNKLLSCYMKSEDYYNVAVMYEKEKEIEKTTNFFADFVRVSPENRTLLLEEAEAFLSKKRSKLKSAVRLSALTMHEQSAPLFFEKGYYDMALTGFKITGDHEKVAECYIALEDYYHAVLEYESSDATDKWSRVAELLGVYLDQSYEDSLKRENKLFKEAESFSKENLYDRAVVRYKAINHMDGIYDSCLNLGRDEEALSYFFDHNRFDYANRYLEDKQGIVVSAGFVQEIVSDYRENRGWYTNNHEHVDSIAKLFSVLLKKDGPQQTLDSVDQFLSSSLYRFLYGDVFSKSVLDLMLDVKHCNTILELFKYYRSRRRPIPDELKSFITNLKLKAQKEKDQGLLACYRFQKNKARYEETLEELDITKWNYKLFAESAHHYHKAVHFLISKNQIEDAVRVCRQHRDYRLSARIYEDVGEDVFAARVYREGKYYQDAIRCYRKVGDNQGIARIYERMKEFDKAMALWKKLGKKREISRLLKKIGKQKEKDAQMNLF